MARKTKTRSKKGSKKQEKITMKQALAASFWDTLQVLMYSGIPATGVIVFINTLAYDVPTIARYAPYIASLINVLVFYFKRTLEYLKNKRELPDFLVK